MEHCSSSNPVESDYVSGALSHESLQKEEENHSEKKLLRGKDIVQNVAVVDIVFAVSHLCHFFFRLSKFSFLDLENFIHFYEFCWILLFALYLLQLFMGIILFQTAKDVLVVGQATLQSFVTTCNWWTRISVFMLIVNVIDGTVLSLSSPPVISINHDQKYFHFKLSFIDRISAETVIHIGELLFRIVSIVFVHKFVRQFYQIIELFTEEEQRTT